MRRTLAAICRNKPTPIRIVDTEFNPKYAMFKYSFEVVDPNIPEKELALLIPVKMTKGYLNRTKWLIYSPKWTNNDEPQYFLIMKHLSITTGGGSSRVIPFHPRTKEEFLDLSYREELMDWIEEHDPEIAKIEAKYRLYDVIG